MLDSLESVIKKAMDNGNDVQPFEIAEAIRRSPDVFVSAFPEGESPELTDMTRFGVHLQVDVSTDGLKYVGSPLDWNWGTIVDRMVGDEAQTHVVVRSVEIESTITVDDDFNVVEERTYTVFDQVAPSIPTTVTLRKDTVTDTLEAFAEGVAWSNEQRASYTKLAEAVGVKVPVEGDEHHEG